MPIDNLIENVLDLGLTCRKPPVDQKLKIDYKTIKTGDKIKFKCNSGSSKAIIWHINNEDNWISVQIPDGTIYCAPLNKNDLFKNEINLL